MEEESREITSGRKSPTPQEGAPPRPSDMPGTPSKGVYARGLGQPAPPLAAASVSAGLRPRRHLLLGNQPALSAGFTAFKQYRAH